MLIRPVVESEHLREIAAWLHAEWWAIDGHVQEQTEAFLRAACGPAAPVVFVAEVEGRPLGTAALDTEDLPARRDLSPWLASVLVAPEARRRGVATALIRHVEQHAAALGHARLWLFTSISEAFYAARGWARVGEEENRGQPVTLMVRDLHPTACRKGPP